MTGGAAEFDAKRAGTFPVVGVEDPAEVLLGFGTCGTFRARPACMYTVEHSVHVHKHRRE